jgi:hypothetical protein
MMIEQRGSSLAHRAFVAIVKVSGGLTGLAACALFASFVFFAVKQRNVHLPGQ